jgi:hypothetical protein
VRVLDWTAKAVLAAALVAAPFALYVDRPWDPRLDADRAEELLEAQIGGIAKFHCEREESGGGLDDVDYFCEPREGYRDASFWIGTDEERITEISSAG